METSGTVKLFAADKTATLEQVSGPGAGRVFALRIDVMTLGRSTDNDIVVVDNQISRIHIFLKKTIPGWLVQDNKSRNGLVVNGQKVQESILKQGDIIEVGKFGFRFCDPDVSEATEKRALSADMGGQNIASARPTRAELARTLGEKVYTDENLNRLIKVPPAKSYSESTLNLMYGRVRKPAWTHLQFALYMLGSFTLVTILASALWSKSTHRQRLSAEPQVNRPDVLAAASETSGRSAGKRTQLVRDDLDIQSRGRAERVDQKELDAYLSEARQYLSERDLKSAEIAFKFALTIDPQNSEALNGLKMTEAASKGSQAARSSVRRSKQATNGSTRPVQTDATRQKEATEYLALAKDALKRQSYQDAIDYATKARHLKFAGNSVVSAQAISILNSARAGQREGFAPLIAQAQEKYKVGDFAGSRELCQQLLSRDPAYVDASNCVSRAEAAIRQGRAK